MRACYPEPNNLFKMEFFCFISACDSATEVLLFDLAGVLELGFCEEDFVDRRAFRKRAQEKDSQVAVLFADWYDAEWESMKSRNDVFHRFIGKPRKSIRDVAIHKARSSPQHKHVFVGSDANPDRWEFKEIPDRDALEACECLFSTVESFVNQAVEFVKSRI